MLPVRARRVRAHMSARCCVMREMRLRLLLVLLPTYASQLQAAPSQPQPPFALYPLANDPFANPAQVRAWTKPPSGWAERKPHFCAYRGGLAASGLDTYQNASLGDVVWPQWPVLALDDLATLRLQLEDIRKRGLWLVDISNYVPGDPSDCDPTEAEHPGSTRHISGVCEFHLPRATLDLLQEVLGERYVGMDNGEQDGRYIAYAPGQYRGRGGGPGARPSELRQSFLHFGEFFTRMADDLGNRLMALNSLWDTHAFARTGFYTALGAETAQALPNAQLFYAFLRGAAKQFGTWIWGNASVYNRWGFKTCSMQDVEGEGEGPSKLCKCSAAGTSLALMRRLMYQQILYGTKIFGFETMGDCGDPGPSSPVSPIAKVQHGGQSFAAATELGVHITTFAVVADPMTGYAPPRNLYAGGTAYRQWGNVPFDAGAFWMHNVLDFFYPGYSGSSYHRNESGFITPTPFGDSRQCTMVVLYYY